MSKKLKFKPVISRVKLNPEQAVLTCGCYNTQRVHTGAWNESSDLSCEAGQKIADTWESEEGNVAQS